MPTRTSYIGRHDFNRRTKNGADKPDDQVIAVQVPRLFYQEVFDLVRASLKAGNPKVAPQVVGGLTLVTGIASAPTAARR